MNKTLAKHEAMNNVRTIGELRSLIAACREQDRPSRVNPSLPLHAVLDIFAAALNGRDENEAPKGMCYDIYRRRDVISRDALIIANILRECA